MTKDQKPQVRCPDCGAELQRFTSRLHCPACNQDIALTSNEEVKPLWIPTLQVERMMRECKESNFDTVGVDRKTLEGLLYDSLLWRQERAARQIKPVETSGCQHEWMEVAGKRGVYRPSFFCPKCHTAIVAKYRVGDIVDCVFCGNLRGDAHADDCPRRTLTITSPEEPSRIESGAPRGEAGDRAGPQVSPLPHGFVTVAQCASCCVQDFPGARHHSQCACGPGELVRQENGKGEQT